MRSPSKLALQHVERRLKNLQPLLQDAKIRGAWITYMREAMCLTQSRLAKLAGLSQTTVQQIEKRELAGKVTIETMRKIATAMNCDFVYAFIPKRDLTEFLKEKALAKAARIISEADIHMTLEDQRVSSDISQRIERLANELLTKGDIW